MDREMWRSRGWWAATAVVLYIAAAALRADPRSPIAWLALGLGPLSLTIGWRLTAVPSRGIDTVAVEARRASRVVVAGTALALVAALLPSEASFIAAQRLGIALACVASLVALGRVTSLGGIAARRVRSDAPAYAVGLLWLAALALAFGRAIFEGERPILAQLNVDYACVAASLGSLSIAMVAAYRLYAQRRFELGVSERAAAALWLTVLASSVAVLASLMSVADPARATPLTALTAAVLITVAAMTQTPTGISRLLRAAASVVLLCAPVVSIAVVVAYKWPTHAGLILFVVASLAGLLGLFSPKLAARLAPERGLWLEVLERATVASKQPDPRQAVIAVLSTIRDGMGLVGLSEEEGIAPHANQAALYRLASSDRVTVDRAGYMHVAKVDIPMKLVDLASQEPEQVLSTESLRYVQVTRPEVRELVAWLDARRAGMVALVLDEDVCVGMLLWPAAGRSAPLSYEEVRAARQLADHLGAVTGAAAQLARSRERELAAEQAVAEIEQRVAELRAVIARQTSRQRALSEMFARPARATSYSPAAQAALVAVERMGQLNMPFSLAAPAGIDPVCWAAVAHLASPRADGTLIIVDAASSEEQPIGRWQDASTSPLEVARDGTLVLIDPTALPVETQRYLAAARADDCGLVLVHPSSASPEALGEHLAALVEDRLIVLPTLAERAEDLRALALHKLSRIGLRLRGRPYGISLQAQALLNEHDWPGNDAELEAALLRAALSTRGDVVGPDELTDAIGLSSAQPLSRRREA